MEAHHGDYTWVCGEREGLFHHLKIGNGGYGEIFDCNEKKFFARKLLRAFGTVTSEDIKNEVLVLKTLSQGEGHQNLIRIWGHGWLDRSCYYFIDMDLCDLNLHDYIHGERPKSLDTCRVPETSHNAIFLVKDRSLPLRLRNIWSIMTHIAQGLEFLHAHSYIHGDLKPQNVLYQSRQQAWKIGDFGTTTNKPVWLGSHVRTRGSESYRAPEIISEPSLVTHKVDIWALGCILYELLTSKKAFGGDIDVCEYALTLRAPQISIPTCPTDLQAHLSESLEELLAVDCTRRPVAADARCVFYSYKRVPGSRTLEHNFLSLPSYQEWKKFVYDIPDHLNNVCEIAEERQISGDEDGADRVWNDMIQQHFSPSRCSSETLPDRSALYGHEQDSGKASKAPKQPSTLRRDPARHRTERVKSKDGETISALTWEGPVGQLGRMEYKHLWGCIFMKLIS